MKRINREGNNINILEGQRYKLARQGQKGVMWGWVVSCGPSPLLGPMFIVVLFNL